MTQKSRSTLLVPAIKASIGDWAYYISFMRLSDVVARVSVAEEIHTAKALRDLLQRGLKNRAPDIAEYLRTSPQRFFNALVIGSYGGQPKWQELSISPSSVSQADVPEYAEGALGFLTLSGDETLFAIDGQHRVAGIRLAVQQQPDLGDEEVAMIFLRGVTKSNRSADPSGFERTRRLFTTLNSRAKAAGKRDIIALDEDDVIAITTRSLVEENRLFIDKISSKGSRSLSPNNKTDLTTIITLYDALDVFFKEEIKKENPRKRHRPDEAVVLRFVDAAKELFSLLVDNVKPLSELSASQPEDQVAAKYRSRSGGHLLFRPVGFLIVHRVLASLVAVRVPLKEAVKRLSALPMDLAASPWKGLLWDDTNRRMITEKENQKVAERIAFHGLGGDLAYYKTDTTAVRRELAGLLNLSASPRLPRYVP